MYPTSFLQNQIIDITSLNISKTIKMRPCHVFLSYSDHFYDEHKILIESKIQNFTEQGVGVSLNVGTCFSAINLLKKEVDVCIVDKDYIPRTDCIVKFNQYLNLNQNSLIKETPLTSNIEFIDSEVNQSFYVCEKPEEFIPKYSYFNYFRGITYLPAKLARTVLSYDKSRIPCSELIAECLLKNFPKQSAKKLPIILAFTFQDHMTEFVVKEIVFSQISLPRIDCSSKREKIAAIIPFKNNAELTIQCIRSLHQAWDDVDIYAVNNNSDEETIRQVKQEQCKIVDAKIQYNYSMVNNIGLSYINLKEYEYLLLLNNDVIVGLNAIQEMLNCFIDETIGAVGCKLLYPDGRVQFGGVGLSHKYKENQHLWYHIDQFKEQADCSLSNYVQHSHSLTAACMLLRKDAVIRCGLFDADTFPIGFSDAFLALNFRKNGFNLIYTPNAICIHHESVSRGYGYPDDFEGIILERGSKIFDLPNLTWEVLHGLR